MKEFKIALEIDPNDENAQKYLLVTERKLREQEEEASKQERRAQLPVVQLPRRDRSPERKPPPGPSKGHWRWGAHRRGPSGLPNQHTVVVSQEKKWKKSKR